MRGRATNSREMTVMQDSKFACNAFFLFCAFWRTVSWTPSIEKFCQFNKLTLTELCTDLKEIKSDHWPVCDPLHDLCLLHALELWHVSHDAGVAGEEALGCFQRLVPLRTRGQQLTRPLSHTDLIVNLLLDVTVLEIKTKSHIRFVANIFCCIVLHDLEWTIPLKSYLILHPAFLPPSKHHLAALRSISTSAIFYEL